MLESGIDGHTIFLTGTGITEAITTDTTITGLFIIHIIITIIIRQPDTLLPEAHPGDFLQMFRQPHPVMYRDVRLQMLIRQELRLI